MELTLTTPALLFPAISLLFLSYTNKFLALASLIRTLHGDYIKDPGNQVIKKQLENLGRRMKLIKHMQGAGIMSFILCVVDMFLLHLGQQWWAFLIFGLCLAFFLLSLLICLTEIKISVDALELQVEEMKH
ncbi:DUF2721 domain-containing protein [Endozoicomonas sp. Mp262]|uniref:DUF2721 domain-containing protein n=1 Tax=Endozoicomonas sp. Mp262 TaxID=2919499 RepID=UPI0021DA57D3